LFKETEKKRRNFSQDNLKEIRNGHLWNTSQRYLCLRKDTPPQNTPFQIHAISELMFFKNVRK
jgi:hypothetical protein